MLTVNRVEDAYEHVKLRDGTTVLLRPIAPTDTAALRRLFFRLSPGTVYLRFFSPVSRPRESTLRYLASVDGVDRLAVVAVRDDEIVGVARCDRLSEGMAEVAVVVEDALQGRGLGRTLVERLGADARRRGIEWFVATILPENGVVKEMVMSVPGAQIGPPEDGIVDVRIPLGDGRSKLRAVPVVVGGG